MAVTIPGLTPAPELDPVNDLLIVSHGGVTYSTTFLALLTAYAATLPTTIPTEPGLWWLNGGALSVTS